VKKSDDVDGGARAAAEGKSGTCTSEGLTSTLSECTAAFYASTCSAGLSGAAKAAQNDRTSTSFFSFQQKMAIRK
jgi:hypothetical protein